MKRTVEFPYDLAKIEEALKDGRYNEIIDTYNRVSKRGKVDIGETILFNKDLESKNKFLEGNREFLVNNLFRSNTSKCLMDDLVTDEEIVNTYEEKERCSLLMSQMTSLKHFRELCPNYREYRDDLLKGGEDRNNLLIFKFCYDRKELLEKVSEDKDFADMYIHSEQIFGSIFGGPKFEDPEELGYALKIASSNVGHYNMTIVGSNRKGLEENPNLFVFAFNNFTQYIPSDIKFPEMLRSSNTVSKLIKFGNEPFEYSDLKEFVTDTHLRTYVANQPNTFESLNKLASIPEYRRFLTADRYIYTAFSDMEEVEDNDVEKWLILRKMICNLPRELYRKDFKELFAEIPAFKRYMKLDFDKLSYDDLQKRACNDVRNISRNLSIDDASWAKDYRRFIDMSHAAAFINDGYKDSNEIPNYYENDYLRLSSLDIRLECTDAIGHMKRVEGKMTRESIVMRENIYKELGMEENKLRIVYEDIEFDGE
ncbi:MAG: hypothetical protein N4A47_03735 [Clostridia bacterium]|nr:hypothetical protein [Clostridia bacterium]